MPPVSGPDPWPRLLLRREGGFAWVAKPPGLSCTRGREDPGADTVADVLRRQEGLTEPPRLCHRLDRDTSGVLLMALTAQAQAAASAEFEHKRVRKTYLALCAGDLSGAWLLDLPLGPDPAAPRGQRARQRVDPEGKPARTVVVAMGGVPGWTVVAARPSTGRTHQVRAHLSRMGHPVAADPLYGGPGTVAGADRVMLHAGALALRAGGVDLWQTCPPWPDLASVLGRLGLLAVDPGQADDLITRAVRQGLARPWSG